MPIGAAIGIAGAFLTQDVGWLSHGVTKVITYPELVPVGSRLGQPQVRVDGTAIELEQLIDLEAAVRREYEQIKPRIIAAALTRLAARAAVAEGVRAAGKQQSNALGDVLAVVVEGALVALDRPDTRSWTMMPGRVLVARVPLPPGKHEVEVDFSGVPQAHRVSQVDMAAGSFATLVITDPQ
jgi:hypothetical protein